MYHKNVLQTMITFILRSSAYFTNLALELVYQVTNALENNFIEFYALHSKRDG